MMISDTSYKVRSLFSGNSASKNTTSHAVLFQGRSKRVTAQIRKELEQARERQRKVLTSAYHGKLQALSVKIEGLEVSGEDLFMVFYEVFQQSSRWGVKDRLLYGQACSEERLVRNLCNKLEISERQALNLMQILFPAENRRLPGLRLPEHQHVLIAKAEIHSRLDGVGRWLHVNFEGRPSYTYRNKSKSLWHISDPLVAKQLYEQLKQKPSNLPPAKPEKSLEP